MAPIITVLTAVYNGERYLAETLDSISAQTLRDIEILVVDDGSTDATPQILAAHARRDPRLRVISIPNGGVSRALNLGLKEAAAPLIARLDADDLMEPERLQAQVGFMRDHPQVGMCGSDYTLIDAEGRPFGLVRQRPYDDADLAKMFADQAPISLTHPTMTYRREDALAVGGYDPAFEPAEDMAFFAKMLLRGVGLAMVPRPLVRYRVYGDSISSRKLWRQLLTRDHIRRNFYRARAGLPPMAREESDRIATRPRSWGEFEEARALAADYQKKRAFFAQAAARPRERLLRLALASALRPERAVAALVRRARARAA